MKKIVFLRLSPTLGIKHPHPESIPIPFEIAYLVNLLPKGFRSIVIDTYAQPLTVGQIIRKTLDTSPFLLAIDTQAPTADIAVQICNKIKTENKKIFIVIYGAHATYVPKCFLYQKSPVDFCILGEVEETFVALVQKLSGKNKKAIYKIAGIAFWDKKLRKIIKTKPRPLIKNLDELPFMAHKYFVRNKVLAKQGSYFLKNNRYYALFLLNKPPYRQKWGFLLTSRGCPFNCPFCSPAIRNSYGRVFRTRNPKLVVDEMEYLVKKLKVNAILFEDDIFTLDLKRVKEICEEIIKRELKADWVTQTRVDRLNLKILKKMKEAGCSCITIGAESGSKKILKKFRKGITKTQVKKVVNWAKKLGISVNLNFIVGFPGETPNQAEETLNFAKELNPTFVHFHYLTPYPGTEIYEQCTKKGELKEKDLFYHQGAINLSKIPDTIYPTLLKKFYRQFYFSPRYLLSCSSSWLLAFIFNPQTRYFIFKNTLGFLFGK